MLAKIFFCDMIALKKNILPVWPNKKEKFSQKGESTKVLFPCIRICPPHIRKITSSLHFG